MPLNLRKYPRIRSIALRGTSSYWRFRERYIQNYVFIHINKTGGRSVETALGCVYEHKTALEKIAEIGPGVWDAKFTFAFVRNPWDRAVSQYAYRRKTKQHAAQDEDMSFDTWLERVYVERDPTLINKEILFAPQSHWLTDADGALLVDFVGRFERFEEDFRHVCDQIGKHAVLPHKNRSSRAAYPAYYTDHTAQIIARTFEEDIERFGYSFDA
ncbi:MAG: sulfotransferase family 2 domain-containing protein [Rhodothermales bacterium]|nr:sulfotransferase family 2 domain-containing protein [Rhodothermales bacterium]